MRIPKQIFKKMSAVAADESTRYAINGVRFARDKMLLTAEATDSRMLLRTQWLCSVDSDGDFDTILSKSALNKVRLPARVKQVELKETDVNGSVTVRALSNVNTKFGDEDVADQDVDTIDGHFPKTDDIIPDPDLNDKTACHVFAVDPKLFATLLDTIGRITFEPDKTAVRIVCPLDPNKPIRIDASSDDVMATGVLMPVNLGGNASYTRTVGGAA